MLIDRCVHRFDLLHNDGATIGRHEIHLYVIGGGRAGFDYGPSSRKLQTEKAGIKQFIGDDNGRARRVLYMWRHTGGDQRGAGGERANDR